MLKACYATPLCDCQKMSLLNNNLLCLFAGLLVLFEKACAESYKKLCNSCGRERISNTEGLSESSEKTIHHDEILNSILAFSKLHNAK